MTEHILSFARAKGPWRRFSKVPLLRLFGRAENLPQLPQRKRQTVLSSGQLLQRCEAVAHSLPFCQQLVENIRVGRGGGVEEDDCAVVDTGQELGKRLFRRRLIVGVPVHIGQAPEDGFVPQRLGLAEIVLAVLALGRTVEPG